MSYAKKTVSESRSLLNARGISVTSKKKAELIELLEEDDEVELTNGATVNDVAAKVTGLPPDKTGEISVDSTAAARLKMLEIQLEIERAKLRQIELSQSSTVMTSSAVASPNEMSSSGLSHIRNRLPVMPPGQETNILQFFCNFERHY